MGRSGARQRLTAALAGVLAALLAAQPVAAACRDDVVELRFPGGQARFSIELAVTAEGRARGLMFRDSLPRSSGMLFVYPAPIRATFWMRNTFIPLDMIFADPAGRVTHVHANAVPRDETTIDGGPGVLAVLEINGGLAARLGIVPGAEMRHPAFGDGAAWPCD
jgi:uncharacterized membrane protein (UPF0127 family)